MTLWIPMMLASVLTMPPGTGSDSDGPPRGKHGPPGDISKFVEQVAQAVNATEEQVTKLEAIAAEHRQAAEDARAQRKQAMEANREELHALREQMREAREARDRQRAREIRDQMRGIAGQDREELMRQTHDKIAAVLTPEQLPAFQELVAEHKQRRQAKGGKGRFGDRPGKDGGKFRIHRFMRRLSEAISPSEEQQQQLQTIASEHVEAMKAAQASLATARQENREELQALRGQIKEARQAGDKETARALHEQMRTIVGTPGKEVIDSTLAKIAALLTEEQKPEFDALVAEMSEKEGKRHRDHWGRGKGKGPRRHGKGHGGAL